MSIKLTSCETCGKIIEGDDIYYDEGLEMYFCLPHFLDEEIIDTRRDFEEKKIEIETKTKSLILLKDKLSKLVEERASLDDSDEGCPRIIV